jgi:hypothetical protein
MILGSCVGCILIFLGLPVGVPATFDPRYFSLVRISYGLVVSNISLISDYLYI